MCWCLFFWGIDQPVGLRGGQVRRKAGKHVATAPVPAVDVVRPGVGGRGAMPGHYRDPLQGKKRGSHAGGKGALPPCETRGFFCQIRLRVNGFPVFPDFKVQVRAGRPAGRADKGDDGIGTD